MKLPVLIISVLFTFSTILSSCCHTIQCTNSETVLNNLTFLNFTKPELDTVVIRRFAQQTNFTTPIDSLVLDSVNISFFSTDSTSFSMSFYGPIDITVGYDYEIFVPATNTLAKVNNLLEPQSSQKSCPGESGEATPSSCINPYTSIYVNGTSQESKNSIIITK